MIRTFEENSECRIILDPPIVAIDIEQLQNLFLKNHCKYIVEFGRIYSVDIVIINLLYKEIFYERKDIFIITHKNILDRYLNQLGFNTHFISLIKESIVHVSEVKVILIGGSTDSSQKIIEILKHTKIDNISIVIVQHIEPYKLGHFDEILQKYTNYKVSYARDGEKIKKGAVYLAVANKHLKVKDGYIVLSDEAKHNYSRPSVSVSYESFSSYYRESLLVIQECGYANDGVDKLKLLRKNGSKIIIQDSSECEAKPMVLHAQDEHMHHYIFKLDDIIAYINFINTNKNYDEWVVYLLDTILKKYGHDFRLYQRNMLKRRIEVFMIHHEMKNIKDAIGVILFNEVAFKSFLLEISINVTELFRKPKSFQAIKDILKKQYKNTHNIKVWNAGCSSGEEAYSIAIILDSLKMLDKSMIYATDFNSVVLDYAKNTLFSYETYATGKSNLLEIDIENNLDYYVTKNSNYVAVKSVITKKILFFQHNLVTDSSFNEFDIIMCKNVLIYFDSNLQGKVLSLFYDSLKFGGYLVLGESESMHPLFSDKFKKCDTEFKIFKKVA